MTMLGRKHSLETKQKMSESAKGNKSFTGQKHTEEWKQKMRGSRPNRKGIPAWNKGMKFGPLSLEKRILAGIRNKGANNPNWKGGITPKNIKIRESMEGRAWKRAVLQKDGFKCIWCGETKKLHIDHIKPFADFPELRFEVSNGRVLCKECHRKSLHYCRECGVKMR